MSSILIECRNKLSENSIAGLQEPAGDFTTIIQEKISLEEGDTISMKKCFIDTNANSTQQIVVPKEGITLEMEFIHYQNNFEMMPGYRNGEARTWTGGFEDEHGDPTPVEMLGDWAPSYHSRQEWRNGPLSGLSTLDVVNTEPKGDTSNDGNFGGVAIRAGSYGSGICYADGNMYLACAAKSMVLDKSYKLRPIILKPVDSTKAWGNFMIYFNSVAIAPVQYPAPTTPRQNQRAQFAVPPQKPGTTSFTVPFSYTDYHYEDNPATSQRYEIFHTAEGSGTFFRKDTGNIVINPPIPIPYNNTFVFVPNIGASHTAASINWPAGSYWSEQLKESEHLYTPIPRKTSIFLPQGNYDPTKLAQYITDEVSAVGVNGPPVPGDLAQSDFLTQIEINSGTTWVNPVSTLGPSPGDPSGNTPFWNDATQNPMANALDFRYRHGTVGAGGLAPDGAGDGSNARVAAAMGAYKAGLHGGWNHGGINYSEAGNQGNRVFQETPTLSGTFSGTNQMSFKFNPISKRFFWEYTHMPFYNGIVESAGFSWVYNTPSWGIPNQKGGSGRNNKSMKPVRAAGGILFTALNSYTGKSQTEGNYTNFWTDQLGFDTDITSPTCILVAFDIEQNKTPSVSSPAVGPMTIVGDREMVYKPVLRKTPSMPDGVPVVGVHITGGLLGISDAMDVVTNATPTTLGWLSTTATSVLNQYTPWDAATGNAGRDGAKQMAAYMPVPLGMTLSTTGSKTNEIIGFNGVLEKTSSLAFGYYLIEVHSNFQNSFITPKQNFKSMMGVVSRYYERATFTSATEADSLIYTHRGAPVLLSDFRIRILDSEKNLAANLGLDNTVFLSITKAPQNLEYPPGMGPPPPPDAVPVKEKPVLPPRQ